jgi:mycofactocin precursor
MIEKEKQDSKPTEINTMDQEKKTDDNIFSTTEVKIEEMAIDGICGVY